ncbi:uncharacterized protein LOC128953130 [Oppia nitens]|uniref:uncharacterized protein LOC128953130 n=1 Tax=Oppia nitens TaxID=1686743 RepID=UPI0023DBE52A|nr:uncharacterized protein LOC128953130 [Oppia nitens]
MFKKYFIIFLIIISTAIDLNQCKPSSTGSLATNDDDQQSYYPFNFDGIVRLHHLGGEMDRKGIILDEMSQKLQQLFKRLAHLSGRVLYDFDFALRDDIRPLILDWSTSLNFTKRNQDQLGDKMDRQLSNVQQLLGSLAQKIKRQFDRIIAGRVRIGSAIYPGTRLQQLFESADFNIGSDLTKPFEQNFTPIMAEFIGNWGSAMNWALDKHLEVLLAPGVGRPIPAYLQQFRRYWNQHIHDIQSILYA